MNFNLGNFVDYYFKKYSDAEKEQAKTILEIYQSIFSREGGQQSSEGRQLNTAAEEAVPSPISEKSLSSIYWTCGQSIASPELGDKYVLFLKILNQYENLRKDRIDLFGIFGRSGRLNDPTHLTFYFLKERLKFILSAQISELTVNELDKLYEFIYKIVRGKIFPMGSTSRNFTRQRTLWEAAKHISDQIKPLVSSELEIQSPDRRMEGLRDNTEHLFRKGLAFLVYSLSNILMPDGFTVEGFPAFLAEAEIDLNKHYYCRFLLNISRGTSMPPDSTEKVVKGLLNPINPHYRYGLSEKLSTNIPLMQKYVTALCLLQELKKFKHNFSLLTDCTSSAGALSVFGLARDELILDLHHFRLFLSHWYRLISDIHRFLDNEYMECITTQNVSTDWQKNFLYASNDYKQSEQFCSALVKSVDFLDKQCSTYTVGRALKDAQAAYRNYLTFRRTHFNHRQRLIQHLDDTANGTGQSVDFIAVTNSAFTLFSTQEVVQQKEDITLVSSFFSKKDVNKDKVIEAIRNYCHQEKYGVAGDFVRQASRENIEWDIKKDIQDRIYPLFTDCEEGLVHFFVGVVEHLFESPTYKDNPALKEAVLVMLNQLTQVRRNKIRTMLEDTGINLGSADGDVNLTILPLGQHPNR